MQEITFNELPSAIMELNRKVDTILSQLPKDTENKTDGLLTIEALSGYLPEHPARQTIYGWVNGRSIPFEKHGKRLYFRKSNIDKWLSNGRQTG